MSDNKKPIFSDEDITEISPKKPEKVEPTLLAPKGNVLNLLSQGEFGYPTEIQYRDILVKDEEVMAGASPDTLSETITGVLKSVCNDCEFFEQLTVFDRDFVMVWMAANTYGREKDMEFTCPHCDAKNHQKYNLLGDDVTDPKFGIFPISIPVKSTGGSVTVRLNTVADEIFASKYIKNKRKTAGELTHDQIMLYRSIEIDGAEGLDFHLKVDWIRKNMTTKEIALVKKSHVYGSYGLPRVITLTCSSCKEDVRTDFPFRLEDLFVPDVHDDFAELLQRQQDAKDSA